LAVAGILRGAPANERHESAEILKKSVP
jgi:hypothetical protein